jgi:tetratricopeptide (TPR) repeat protein
MDAARRVLEAAYDKAEGAEKTQIASVRAKATFDSEDRLAWLRKSNTSLPHVRVDIDSTEASLAFASGRYEAAVAPLKSAAAYYAGLPESGVALNNASLIQRQLARATGDLKYDLEGLRMVRRAHELLPEDGIVLANYVSDLHDVGISALAGSALRPELLHEQPGESWMDYVVPSLSPKDWAVRAKAQPELRRAAELGVKSIVLSPGNDVGYDVQVSYLNLIQDVPGLRRLRESLESKPPVREEDDTQDEAHARGAYTDSERKAMERGIARWEGLIPGIRKAGHGPTLAFALKGLASSRMGSLRIGIGGQKMETIVREAEEAVAVFDAPATRHSLAWFLSEQAVREYSTSDEDFGRWVKDNSSVNGADLLALYVRKHPERAAPVRDHAGLRRATQAIASLVGSEKRNLSVWVWAWLEMMGHESREAARKALQSDPTLAEWHQIKRLLNPKSPGGAVNAWLAALALGEKDLAAKFAAQAREAGLVPLFFKE